MDKPHIQAEVSLYSNVLGSLNLTLKYVPASLSFRLGSRGEEKQCSKDHRMRWAVSLVQFADNKKHPASSSKPEVKLSCIGEDKAAFSYSFKDEMQAQALSDLREDMERFSSYLAAYDARDFAHLPELFAAADEDCSFYRQEILKACAKVPAGFMVSYADLNALAFSSLRTSGYKGAGGCAQSAGTVMKNNPIPLFIPCHRVLSESDLQGRTCDLRYNLGSQLKLKLLAHEAGVSLSKSLEDALGTAQDLDSLERKKCFDKVRSQLKRLKIS